MRLPSSILALLAGLVGAAISLAGFIALSGRGVTPEERAGTRSTLSRAVATLERDLQAQRRAQLELERRLEALETRTPQPQARGPEPVPEAPLPLSHPTSMQPEPASLQPARPWFDSAALAEAGLDAEEIAELRAPFEETELARLFLQDRARREGWVGSERYREGLRQLREQSAALRERLGEERYDWYRYATGQPNRIRVRDVLDRSPAARAGLQTGDLIVRYDDRRVFGAQELRREIARGRANEQVPLDLLRRGEELRIWLPRGPLGIQLQAERVRPARTLGASFRLRPADFRKALG